jgi:hypothetical protein
MSARVYTRRTPAVEHAVVAALAHEVHDEIHLEYLTARRPVVEAARATEPLSAMHLQALACACRIGGALFKM